VAAFVDWQMRTVGDPLASMGGLAGRQELLDAYLGAHGGRAGNPRSR
jgi:hypothetical protein